MCVCVLLCAPPADGALSLRLQGREHDDDGVVPGRRLDKATELVSVHADDRATRRPLHHLVHLLRQQVLKTEREREEKDEENRVKTVCLF